MTGEHWTLHRPKTLRLLNALNSEDRSLKVRFSLATIAFDRESAQMSQILSSQGKNAPSNPYPHYLVRFATSRNALQIVFSDPPDSFGHIFRHFSDILSTFLFMDCPMTNQHQHFGWCPWRTRPVLLTNAPVPGHTYSFCSKVCKKVSCLSLRKEGFVRATNIPRGALHNFYACLCFGCFSLPTKLHFQ